MLKIVVPIKQVPETSNVKMDPETGTMIRTGVDAIINPLDLYAIETALQLKEAYEGTVTAVSMGPKTATLSLREALALGCDNAVLLSHSDFRGADTWATAYTLAQAVRKISNVDIIICGERATDGETGQVGPSLAGLLGLPLVTYIRKITDVSQESIMLERMIEGGIEVVRSRLPILITVVKEIANPRLPTLRGMKFAKATDVIVWGPQEIKADPEWIGLKGSPTRVVKIHKSKVSRGGKIITVRKPEELKQAADQLINYLIEKNIQTGG